jgi:AcrR family transcriptional regulator
MAQPRTARRTKRPLRAIQHYARTAYRDAILDAAEKLFRESGYREAKMAELATEAGVSVGTLYKHFKSKEAVFASLAARARKDFAGLLELSLAEPEPLSRLSAIVDRLFAYIEERGVLFAIYAEIGVVLESHIRSFGGEVAEQTYDRFLSVLEAVFRDGVRAGKIRRDIPASMLAASFAGSLNSVLCAWVRADRKYSLASRRGPLVDLFLEGASVK